MGAVSSEGQEVEELIHAALTEDGVQKDHSSFAAVAQNQKECSIIQSRQKGVICGTGLVKKVFGYIDPQLEVRALKSDGEFIEADDKLFHIEGSARSILAGERTALNFLRHLTAISSLTRQLVDKVSPYNVQLLDTRKTTPGFRKLEKYAVNCGGGTNHRYGLHDMIMLKDNHLDYAGGATQALQLTKDYLYQQDLVLPIVVEVRDLNELREVLLEDGATRVLLDNFSIEGIIEALKLIDGRIPVEASGGVTFQNIEELASTGVDFISTSLMTTAVGQFDLTLKAAPQ